MSAPFFISHDFIEFWEYVQIFHFFLRLKFLFKISKNERNVTNFGYIFVTIFHVKNTTFPGGYTYTVIAQIFFSKT